MKLCYITISTNSPAHTSDFTQSEQRNGIKNGYVETLAFNENMAECFTVFTFINMLYLQEAIECAKTIGSILQ